MGVVWRATDHVLEREVALKEITFPLHTTAEEREVLRERTRREARAAARLDHPNVTTVYDVVEDGGEPWLVMEHVPSRSLQEIVDADGPLPPATVARIGLDVLSALEAAHRAGIVHRDVKPANVLVGADGHAWLTDFGIASTTGSATLTMDGIVLGSPSYMAPERAHGEDPLPPVDLWSLGATLYTAVEGRLPFSRGEPMATLLAVVSEDPEPPVAAGPLAPALHALLTKEPARRAGVDQARLLLQDVVAGRTPAGPHAAGGLPGTPTLHVAAGAGNRVERFDRQQLRALASASRSALGAVARDARTQARDVRHRALDGAIDQARTLAERRATPTRTAGPATGPRAPRRFRFKRRWVVVPAAVGLLLLTLLVAGLVLGAVLLSRSF
ncbi:protein kinase [Modestobacter sp. I12A-02628]|uniref:non-specific serine/threonine protein kinase n=2 Tax=Goekera deserti TaxID=2497753 RepID=A0A7K3WBY0_9ACTN|nr:protein kinase [Goekera deserti]NDI48135.1 protein kinase [Goekera deserti]NEL53884.1 serine/threonine protein kinase [Goekera deserti]